MFQQSIQSAVDGIVVHMGADSEMGVVAELSQADTRVAGNDDVAHARLWSGGHLKRNIDQLIVRMRRQRVVDGGLMEAVLRERGAHLVERASELFLGKARAGGELCGAHQLGIHGCAGGSIGGHGSDKHARRTAEDQIHATGDALGLYLDIFVKAGGEELAQAFFEVVRIERLALGLGKLTGNLDEAEAGDAGEGDVPNGESGPFEAGIRDRFTERRQGLAGSGRA